MYRRKERRKESEKGLSAILDAKVVSQRLLTVMQCNGHGCE